MLFFLLSAGLTSWSWEEKWEVSKHLCFSPIFLSLSAPWLFCRVMSQSPHHSRIPDILSWARSICLGAACSDSLCHLRSHKLSNSHSIHQTPAWICPMPKSCLNPAPGFWIRQARLSAVTGPCHPCATEHQEITASLGNLCTLHAWSSPILRFFSQNLRGKPQLCPSDPNSTPFLDIPSSILAQSQSSHSASLPWAILLIPVSFPALLMFLISPAVSQPSFCSLYRSHSPSSCPDSSLQPSGLLFASFTIWVGFPQKGEKTTPHNPGVYSFMVLHTTQAVMGWADSVFEISHIFLKNWTHVQDQAAKLT